MDEPWILVVDGNSQIRDCIEKCLGGAGYLVRAVATCREAFVWIDVSSPSLLLLDQKVSFGDGCGLLDEIACRGIAIHVCMMTTCLDPHGLARRIGRGELLIKPFGIDELLGVVERTLAHREA